MKCPEYGSVRAGLCHFPRVNKKLSAIWDDDDASIDAAPGYPTQAALEIAWTKSFREAQTDAEADGMKLAVVEADVAEALREPAAHRYGGSARG